MLPLHVVDQIRRALADSAPRAAIANRYRLPYRILRQIESGCYERVNSKRVRCRKRAEP